MALVSIERRSLWPTSGASCSIFKEPCCRGSRALQMEIHCKHDPFAAMHSKFLPSLLFQPLQNCKENLVIAGHVAQQGGEKQNIMTTITL